MSRLCEKDDVRMIIDIPDGDQRDDPLIDRLIQYTSGLFERMTDRSFEEQTFTEYFDPLPGQDRLILRNYPVRSWAGLTDIDGGTTYASDEFQVKEDSGIVLLLDNTFPSGDKKIVFTYTAGYTSGQIPYDVQSAIALQTASFYNNASKRGFKEDKLDAMRTIALGSFEPEFEEAVRKNRKWGHRVG